MVFNCDVNGTTVTLALQGELDHHAATQTLRQVGEQIERNRPTAFYIDMRGVSFMDSSGIAVLLGSYRRMQEIGGTFTAVGVSAQARRVLSTAGVDRLIALE